MAVSDPALSKEAADDLVAQSLSTRGVPERVHYATGVLLGAEDFAAEQLYLRGRLGRAFAAQYGHGTVAGLRVSCPAADNLRVEVRVAPGLALDRLGRQIEVRRTQCIHVADWIAQRNALPASATERNALIDAVRDGPPGTRRVVLDVWARFAICPHGKTPAFAAGPFNATDHVVPARLADAFELTLQIAHTDDEGNLVLPQPRSEALNDLLLAMQDITDPTELEAARRAWCVASALDAWPAASPLDPKRLPKLAEHPTEADWDRVLLGRVSVPVTQPDADGFPFIDTFAMAEVAAEGPKPPGVEPLQGDLADNGLRPVVFNPYSWRGAA
jgi:hypothetical protein